jgi:hypothetical protein
MTIHTNKNTTKILACLVLDDPLIKPQYGYLDYAKLLHAMKEHNFFTEIAFIPWNWRRSDPQTVRLLSENPEHYAICIHGCNHSDNEFGGLDYKRLSTLSSAALWRMEQHRVLTGLSYDPVMVFPQGRFSSIAIMALKNQGYHAAFNSTIQSTDKAEVPDAEYYTPATRMYHDFPLFLRRYPGNKEGFLKDISNGRPIIIVEHHGAFKNGYKNITDFIDWLNELGNIQWGSLSSIADAYSGSHDSKTANKLHLDLDWSPWERSKIALRRYASEFRDNYVERSSLLTRFYRTLRELN